MTVASSGTNPLVGTWKVVSFQLEIQDTGRRFDMTLYASANDKALVAPRTAAGKPRAGDVFGGGPILLLSIESIDVSAIGDEMFGLNHNVFADNRSLIDDIGRLVLNGTRPPDQRSPQIRCVPEGIPPPHYWRYVP